MDIILQDLIELESTNVSIPICPFNNNDPTNIKIRKIKKVLTRAKRLNKRRILLYCYFILGQILENVEITRAQRMEVRHQLSIYQNVIAIRIFRIFEHRKAQIFRTKRCTPKNFHQLAASDVVLLCILEEDIFTGVENLEGEN